MITSSRVIGPSLSQNRPTRNTPGSIPFHDPGNAERQQAQHLLERARTQLSTAGDHAAGSCGRARDEAPDRSWLEDAADAVGDAAAATVNATASFRNAIVHHTDMVAGLAGGAARHLEKEVQTFRDNIDKVHKGQQ